MVFKGLQVISGVSKYQQNTSNTSNSAVDMAATKGREMKTPNQEKHPRSPHPHKTLTHQYRWEQLGYAPVYAPKQMYSGKL